MEQEPLQRVYQETLANGIYKENRTAVDTVSHFGPQIRIDLQDGFPLPTVKDTWFHGIKHELLWFVRGDTNIKYLVDNGVNIWNDNAYQHYLENQGVSPEAINPQSDTFKQGKEEFIQRVRNDPVFAEEHGDLGPVYGEQWRSFGDNDIDQLDNVIKGLQTNPHSRRHILQAWNPEQVDDMALPPCHVMAQFYVNDEDELTCKLYQRSADLGLGVPFNIPSYALLTHIVADQTGYDVGEFVHTFGDAHFYCGSGERGEAYADLLPDLQARVADAEAYEDFKAIRDDLAEELPPEPAGAENKDQVPAALTMLAREPRNRPTLELDSRDSLAEYTGEDIHLQNYDPHDKVELSMAV